MFDSLEPWHLKSGTYFLLKHSYFITTGMALVHKLSKSGVRDFVLLIGGLLGNAIGYLMLYMLWYSKPQYLLNAPNEVFLSKSHTLI